MVRYIICIALLLFVTTCVRAQRYMICGKITDSIGQPVKKAMIVAKAKDTLFAGYTDDDGLYYTDLVPVGEFSIVVSVADRYYYSSLEMAAGDQPKQFYYFMLSGTSAILTKTDADPYQQRTFNRMKRKVRVDAPERSRVWEE